jgi:hypothetical protein
MSRFKSLGLAVGAAVVTYKIARRVPTPGEQREATK